MTYTPIEQANIEAIYRFMEAEAVQDWDTVFSLISPDSVSYTSSGIVRGHEEMHQYNAAFMKTFPKSRRTILDIVADGDRAVYRWRCEATLQDGRTASWEAVSWAHMKDGQITESWIYLDSGDIQRQLRPPKETTP